MLSRTFMVTTFLFLASDAIAVEPADTLFYNGKVITVDATNSLKSAVAVKDGKIVAVGGAELIGRFAPKQKIDLAGRSLLPGFIDTHVHIFGAAKRSVKVSEAKSIEDLKKMVAAKARELGPGEWITGYGWDEALLAERRVPSKSDLDEAAPYNPVFLIRAGSHSAVGNSMSLKLAGISKESANPEGGVIERSENGEANGIIRERTDIYSRLIPRATPDEMKLGYIASIKALLRFGITSFMEAFSAIDDTPYEGVGPGASAQHPSWPQFRKIYDEIGSDLPRATLYVGYPGADRLKAFPYKTGYGDDRLKLGPIGENPYDGGFSGPTALTKEDYKGQPGFRGKALMTEAAATEMIETAASLGWQVGIHAIGDAALETIAGIYDRALKKYPKADHRWFLAHFSMTPSIETMRMIAKDGIIAAAQPNFLYTVSSRYKQNLDGYRLEHINPVALPMKQGIKFAFGSDNLPIGPMVGIYAAVTRKGADGEVIGADEAISRQLAIQLYTRDAAYLAWDEKKKGAIEAGKFADMIVLDRDPLTVSAEELLQTKVDITMVGGKIVYERKTN
jgi:predicted amidohydrolase YtcJ